MTDWLPEAFRLDYVPGGVRLSLISGVFDGWANLPVVMQTAATCASAVGGRLEVSAVPCAQSMVRQILDRPGVARVERSESLSVYVITPMVHA